MQIVNKMSFDTQSGYNLSTADFEKIGIPKEWTYVGKESGKKND